MELSTYLKKSASSGLGKSIGSALITVVFIPLIILRIGIENYGIWMLLVIFMGISSIADLGLTNSLVYFIPQQKCQEDIDEIYSAGALVNAFMVLIVAIASFGIYFTRINIWGSNNTVPYELGRLLFACGIIIACCLLATGLYRSVLEASFKIYIVNIGFFFLTALNYIAVYFLSFLTNKPEHFVIATTVVYVLIFFLHWLIVHFNINVSFRIPKRQTVLRVIKYAFGFFSIGIFWTITYAANRYLIIYLGGSVSDYGVFDIALKIAFFSLGCLQAFIVPLFSIFAKYGEEKIDEIKYIINRSLFRLGGVYILGCILFVSFGKQILKLFLSNNSQDLFNVSLILILGIVFFAIADPSYRAFLALGRLKLMIKVNLIQPVINVLVIIFFSDLRPIFRVSVAFSLSWAVTALVYIIMFRVIYSNQSVKSADLDFSL